MSWPTPKLRLALCAAAMSLAVTQAGADSAAGSIPNGKPEPMTAHRAKHVVPRSELPPAEPLPDSATSLFKAYGGTKVDVLTYHYDNNRTGWNPAETDLTPAAVSSKNFRLLKQLGVDGNVLAQPLLVAGFVMPDKSTHDVLIVVTGHDTVYAYDAQTYATLWKVSLGRSQSTNDVGCGDVQPEYGIDSTPVIVRSAASAATIYLVSATEPSPYAFHHTLHALDLGTGKDILTPVEIAPKATLSDHSTLTFDPQNQWTRSSLAYHNGALYVAVGSHCDNNSYGISGWLLGYDGELKLQHAFHTIQTPHGGQELASIWMTGFAPAIDSSGNIFVVTGNGDYTDHSQDWGESVLKLAPSTVKVADRFTDSDYQTLNDYDTDFGSGGVMLLPLVKGQTAPPMAVAIGKSSMLYLLNQTHLGGLRPNDGGALQAQYVQGGGVWGGPAFYDGPAGPTVYVQSDSALMTAYALSAGSKPKLTATVQGTTGAGYGGSLPIVSSNGAAAGTGVLWLIRRSAPIELEAYDAVKLGQPLFSANVGDWSNGNGNSFLTPMEANGRVYVPSYKTVSVFGLTK